MTHVGSNNPLWLGIFAKHDNPAAGKYCGAANRDAHGVLKDHDPRASSFGIDARYVLAMLEL